MMGRLRLFALLAALMLALPGTVWAQAAVPATPLEFRDAAERTRFQALTAELRCVKCQNQSLADSDARIARDLRNEVLVLIRQGKSDDEVKQYLVARYGEFVLYRPQVSPATWLLWFGPALLLLAGGFVVARIVARRGAARPAAGPAPEDTDQEW